MSSKEHMCSEGDHAIKVKHLGGKDGGGLRCYNRQYRTQKERKGMQHRRYLGITLKAEPASGRVHFASTQYIVLFGYMVVRGDVIQCRA
jgi:hypothetical protein